MTIMFKLDILDSIFYCMIKALIAYERALPTQNQDFVFYLIFFANKTMNYESVLYVKEVGGPKIQFLLEEIFLLAIICICIFGKRFFPPKTQFSCFLNQYFLLM